VSLYLAHPLPECAMCETPTRRAITTATGGMSSARARVWHEAAA
jgi:hypothetical protein